MASGDSILTLLPQNSTPTATLAAFQFFIAGTSTPNENFIVLLYDNSPQWYADFYVVMPQHYDGNGLTCEVVTGASGSSGTHRFEIAFRLVETSVDIDATSHTYVYNGVSSSVPTQGQRVSGTILFTDGADMDSVTAGDFCVIRVTRNVDHGEDNSANNGYLYYVDIKET